ncbi:hypothetical protein QBC45DRAFT_327502, partial [Copromyces sp. CBS 386.78]
VFKLFTSRNLILFLKKNYIVYPNVKFLGFYINVFGLIIMAERLAAFCNLVFPEIFKVLEIYIRNLKFIRHLIPYYNKISELL